MGFWWILRIPVFLAILVRKQDPCCHQEGKSHWPGSPRSFLPLPSEAKGRIHFTQRMEAG